MDKMNRSRKLLKNKLNTLQSLPFSSLFFNEEELLEASKRRGVALNLITLYVLNQLHKKYVN